MLSVAVGADHAGYELKCQLIPWIQFLGFSVRDMGAYSLEPKDDYPDFAGAVAKIVGSGQTDRGIIICGSGVGAGIVANKLIGIRAGICHDIYSARQGVEHDDMNVLCLGARIINESLAKDLITGFLNARFSGEERHVRRLQKLIALENLTSKTAHKDNLGG